MMTHTEVCPLSRTAGKKPGHLCLRQRRIRFSVISLWLTHQPISCGIVLTPYPKCGKRYYFFPSFLFLKYAKDRILLGYFLSQLAFWMPEEERSSMTSAARQIGLKTADFGADFSSGEGVGKGGGGGGGGDCKQ